MAVSSHNRRTLLLYVVNERCIKQLKKLTETEAASLLSALVVWNIGRDQQRKTT